jgi:hypothetical protein
VDHGAGLSGPSRLSDPGCSITGGWQLVKDAESGTSEQVYGAEVVMCGEAGLVTLFVTSETPGSQCAPIAPLERPLQVLAGELRRLLTVSLTDRSFLF